MRLSGFSVREVLLRNGSQLFLEIGSILRAGGGATHGPLRKLFLMGEPGIGKSSLAVFVRAVAERKWKALGHHRS
jgi:predicted ATP-dependent serine protease